MKPWHDLNLEPSSFPTFFDANAIEGIMNEGIFQPCCALGPPKALTVVACALLVLFLPKAGIEISRFCATCPTVIVWIGKIFVRHFLNPAFPQRNRDLGCDVKSSRV